MANRDWAFGLQPTRDAFGHSPDTIRLPISVNTTTGAPKYTTSIYKGQVVLWNNTLGVVKANAATNTVANIAGVAAEYFPGSAGGTTKTDIAVWQAGPEQKFLIQSDGTTAQATQMAANVKYLLKNAAIVNPTSGNTNTGLSTSELDYSSLAATATVPLRVLGFHTEVGESNLASHVKLVVHFLHGAYFGQDTTVV